MPFKPGYDENRYNQGFGVMAFHKKVSAHLREHSLEAVDLMIETMRNEKAPLKLRLVASKEILDRGIGKPIDTQVQLQIGAQDNGKDVKQMTDAELEAIARSLSSPPPHTAEKEISDAEVVEVQSNQ